MCRIDFKRLYYLLSVFQHISLFATACLYPLLLQKIERWSVSIETYLKIFKNKLFRLKLINVTLKGDVSIHWLQPLTVVSCSQLTYEKLHIAFECYRILAKVNSCEFCRVS